jgi:UDP-glucose 4-epimerase
VSAKDAAVIETVTTLVVGGAGFIGSHLVERWLDRGSVTIFDDLSIGREAFISGSIARGARLVVGDARDLGALEAAMTGHSHVVHLSANPEARAALADPRVDVDQGILATWNVLEAMRRTGARELVFSSSGTVYGPREGSCAEGDLGALPISLYGASKLAGEAMISAYAECFGIRATIPRFGNVVGPRGTHGAALDFLRKLRATPGELEVLGDGRQRKPYLHVVDCVAAVAFLAADRRATVDVVNIAPEGTTSVAAIARACVAASPHPAARIAFTGGERGWPGDIPRSQMNASELYRRGHRLPRSSDDAVADAIVELSREVFPGHTPDAQAVRAAMSGA